MKRAKGDAGPGYLVTVSDLRDGEVFAAEQIRGYEELGVRVLREIVRLGLARCPLPRAVEVSLIDDEAIGQVHGAFMADPTPTDVITFPYGEYGEILISVDTARRQGLEFGRSLARETALYLIHGILHLAGYSDKTLPEQEEMAKIQEELLTLYL